MKTTKTFGEDDYVIDREEIFALSHTNPIVHMVLTLHARGDLTYEQAMMSAVKFLVGQNEAMFKSLVEIEMKRIEPKL